jgi:hypothetical protein
MMRSLQTNARISQGVADVGQDQTDDVQKGANEHHGSHDGKVLARDGFNQITAQAWNGKE